MEQIKSIDYKLLHFDPDNPRLPEHLRGAQPEVLAKYYFDNSVVMDLVDSMVENGFFPHEPMIVKQRDDGEYTVLEGNRRLTALCIAHGRGEAADLPSPEPPLTSAQVERLRRVPCVISDDDAATRKFIGFRHISGPLTWAPEAKARFLAEEINRAVSEGISRPFNHVAKAVGSNAQTVRGSFLALKLLWHARDEKNFDIAQIQSSRFGVWLRLMSSPEFRQYITLQDTNSTTRAQKAAEPADFLSFIPASAEHDELSRALDRIDLDKLCEVLGDVRAPAGGGLPVLRDSRNATGYGQVLMNAAARGVLRDTGNLDAALTIIASASLPDRLINEAKRIDALAEEVKATEYSSELEEAARRLATSANAVRRLAAEPEDL